MSTYAIEPMGPFSLNETIRFAYIDRDVELAEKSLLLGFCRDTTWEPTAVAVTQRDGAVEVQGPVTTREQVARVLGLSVDASGFSEVGDRDPVIARLQATAPGLRPPLMYSAYEAAVFCILTARRSGAQARRMRAALASNAGTVLQVDGAPVTCTPPPAYLVDPDPVPGLDPTRRERLTAVARAASNGQLDTAALAALDPEDARRQLENLPGIGPFSSAIIASRSLGHTDYLAGPITELNNLVGELYHLGHPATAEELAAFSVNWRPWRTWAQLHIRSVTPRLAPETQRHNTRLVAGGR